MVLADGDSWDRYEAAQWRTIAAWLDANPADPDHDAMREFLDDGRRDLPALGPPLPRLGRLRHPPALSAERAAHGAPPATVPCPHSRSRRTRRWRALRSRTACIVGLTHAPVVRRP